MRSPRRAIVVAVSAMMLFAGTACDPIIADPPGVGGAQPGQAPGGGKPGGGQNLSAARDQLNTLTVGSWNSMAGYSRDRFPHWSSQGEGCDTRDVVLKRDGTGVTVADNCKITAGTWHSAYDGKTLTDPQGIDIDHMVPLANAWRTGASTWSEDQREAFANDLTRPQLLAVSASSNRSKGDQDPSQWKPPQRGFWCTYAQSWIAVKSYWKLIVTADEKSALEDMLGTC